VIELLGTGARRRPRRFTRYSEEFATADGSVGAIGDVINVDRYGIYHDELAKFGGEWKFTQRIFVPFFTATGGVVGSPRLRTPLVLLTKTLRAREPRKALASVA
jgi:hypothetical protein